MQKIVINTCFGGFGLSDAAYEKLIEWGVPLRKYAERKSIPDGDEEVIFENDPDTPAFWGRFWDDWTRNNRTHPFVVRVVEELGAAASGDLAKLRIVEIPDGVEWHIHEYDGLEHVAENHRTWL